MSFIGKYKQRKKSNFFVATFYAKEKRMKNQEQESIFKKSSKESKGSIFKMLLRVTKEYK